MLLRDLIKAKGVRVQPRSRSMRTGLAALLACFVGAVPSLVEAQADAEDFETARGLALGTGLRATATGGSALVYTPANLALGRSYHIDAHNGYLVDRKQFSTGLTVTDSATSSVAAGLGVRGFYGPDAPYKGFDGRLALAYAIGDIIGLGIAGRYFFVNARAPQMDAAPPTDGEPPSEGEQPGEEVPEPDSGNAAFQDENGFTLDASVRITPMKDLQFTATGYNLIDRGTSYAPQQLGGSGAYTFADTITIGGEGIVDFNSVDHVTVIAGGGVEFYAGGFLPLRAGYRFDSARTVHSVSGGLGYASQAFSADFGMRQDVAGQSETRLMLSASYHAQ